MGFRDSQGRVGVVDEKCPNHGASLLFGRNEEGACVALSTVGKWTLRKMTSKKYDLGMQVVVPAKPLKPS